jgi:transposase
MSRCKVNQAVDEVRKQEQRNMADEDDPTGLFRAHYLFLYNQENVPPKRADQFAQLKEKALKTGRAWALKENFRELWKCPTTESAEAFFKKWFWWATHSRLEPMRKAAYTIKNHWQGIVNAITKKVSNACTEGLNNKIEKIKRDAFGFRNKKRFRTAILFHCGGLSLSPVMG